MTTIEIPGSGEHEVISLDPLTLETLKNELLFGELGLATKGYMGRNGLEELPWPPLFTDADMCIMYAPEGDEHVPVRTNATATGIVLRFERDWLLLPPKGVEVVEPSAQAVEEMSPSVESLPAGVEVAVKEHPCPMPLADGTPCTASFDTALALSGHKKSKKAKHAEPVQNESQVTK